MSVTTAGRQSRKARWGLLRGSLLAVLSASGLSAQSNAPQATKREPPDFLGYHIERLNDVDGDHCADFAIDDSEEWVWVVSGRTGNVISRMHSAGTPFIRALGCDTDGDGVNDYAIGAGGGIENLAAGCFSIYSGRTGELRLVIWKKTLEKK